MISNCCHHFHDWQVERGNSLLFVSIYNIFLSDNVMQGVTFMMHSTKRMGIPGEGSKIPDDSRGSAEMSVRALGAAECR